MTRSHEDTVHVLLERHGTTYAQDAGIELRDTPAPLFQLLVLANLLSARIGAKVAVASARELFTAGYRTPERMRAASWRQRVQALGRGGYKRYDERTSTMLGDGAALLIDEYGGDLRRVRERADGTDDVLEALQQFPGIGPAGAAIFAREVQGVWPGLAPFFDAKALDGARRIGLPDDAHDLADLVPSEKLPILAAALVRVALDRTKGDPLE